jgi:hypothetical protein
MKIGIDIDNTILNYSDAFTLAARNLKGLEKIEALAKTEVKSLVIHSHGEEAWTALQGHVYSSVPLGVKIFEGFEPALNSLLVNGHTVAYMSHKSGNPISGPPVNLREPVTNFLLSKKLLGHTMRGLTLSYFETKKEKIEAVNAEHFDYFIDDLVDIVTAIDTKRAPIHFGCDCRTAAKRNHFGFENWPSISRFLLAQS